MMDFCHQLNVYGQQIATLLAMIFTMVAFSKVGKKHREETAYTALVGLSLLCIVNIVLAGPIGSVINLVHDSEVLHALWGAVIAAVIVTVLLMVAGKSLKVKVMPPKTVAICFFVGVALANFVGMAIDRQCAVPVKTSR